MGYYINPADMSKEEFLERRGVRLHGEPDTNIVEGGVVVCLVSNGLFTAAGICVSQEELDSFKWPDGRPKRWYTVPHVDLRPYLHGREVEGL